MSSAILSVDDLNDFINPGVACIKPVETLPQQQPPADGSDANPYEVTTEDRVHANNPPPPAQISLTDCLACSGCVTSAEAVLVSLQSHGEVLDTLDRYQELRAMPGAGVISGKSNEGAGAEERIFVASVSPQVRASLAATYKTTEREAGHMISQLLSGPLGLRAGGQQRSGFTWVIDTSVMRDACLVAAADEVQSMLDATSDTQAKKPLLTSACPGWICYAEKTHPHILPHLSKLKSPQALTGTLVKSVLAKKYGVPPEKVWHLAVMPCFDKKLEASRSELTSHSWHGQNNGEAIRDVDCVITARELLMLAESRNISFPCLPRKPVTRSFAPRFPESQIDRFLFSRRRAAFKYNREDSEAVGTSGGYLYHILKTQQARHEGSTLSIQRGRNADVVEYSVVGTTGEPLFKAARCHGFRNITNLVRRLRPARPSRMPGAAGARKPAGGARRPGGAAKDEYDYSYVEVMACPGGCTNGGGQIKVGDVATLRQVMMANNEGGTGIENGSLDQEMLPAQKEWLAQVDEAYWSGPGSDEEEDGGESDGERDAVMQDSPAEIVDGIDRRQVHDLLQHWSIVTGVDLEKLICTTYRVVESDVGKTNKGEGAGSEMEKVSALAVAAGGGW